VLLQVVTSNVGIASPTGKEMQSSESKSLSKTKAAPSPITFIQKTPVENQFPSKNSVNKLKEKSKTKKSFDGNHELLR
jgi:hypothetical protein